jgi:glycosyltransferase involved in cell wall biosynthesis
MKVSILGTRGIPACHGGFETFAEHLARFLHEHGHDVTVYCQNYSNEPAREDQWNGIRRVMLHGSPTALGSMAFDCAAALHASRRPGIILTLGYNTAMLSLLYRLSGNPSLMNMDGIEWRRDKWSFFQRLWLRLNERAGTSLSDHLIADHPEIGEYLSQFVPREKISVIPYEHEPITTGDPTLLEPYRLVPNGYAIVIARPEPENSLLEIVQAFSRKPRGMKLLILGRYFPKVNRYHRKVIEAAGPEVLLADAVYDKDVVQSLRYLARVYIHGHRVGGTNPSLVESLAAGNPVIAHDNQFTRWVAGPEQQYFAGTDDLSEILDNLLDDRQGLDQMAAASRLRHREFFTPDKVLQVYEGLLLRFANSAKYNATLGVRATNE